MDIVIFIKYAAINIALGCLIAYIAKRDDEKTKNYFMSNPYHYPEDIDERPKESVLPFIIFIGSVIYTWYSFSFLWVIATVIELLIGVGLFDGEFKRGRK
jgi:hypothetical protein